MFFGQECKISPLKVEMQTMLLLNAKWDFFSDINIKQTRKKVNQKETKCIQEIIWEKNWSCLYTICGFKVSNWTFVHKKYWYPIKPPGRANHEYHQLDAEVMIKKHRQHKQKNIITTIKWEIKMHIRGHNAKYYMIQQCKREDAFRQNVYFM